MRQAKHGRQTTPEPAQLSLETFSSVVFFQESPAFDEINMGKPDIFSNPTQVIRRPPATNATPTDDTTTLPRTSSRPISRSDTVAPAHGGSDEDVVPENSDIDHFFEGADETFPDLDSFGVGWESRKLASWKAALLAEQEQTSSRRRREAYEQPLYYSVDRGRFSGRPQLWRGGVRERQYGEVAGTGWDRHSQEWGLRERQDQGERLGGALILFRILGGRGV